MVVTSRASLKLVTSIDVDASVDSVKRFLLSLGNVVSGVAGVRVLDVRDGMCRCVWSRSRGVFRRTREAIEISIAVNGSGSSIIYNGSSNRFSFVMEFKVDKALKGSRVSAFAGCRGDERRCNEFVEALADAIASKLRSLPISRAYTSIDPYSLLDPAALATLIPKLELLMQKELGPGQRPEDIEESIRAIAMRSNADTYSIAILRGSSKDLESFVAILVNGEGEIVAWLLVEKGDDGAESLYNEGDVESLRRILARLRESKIMLRLYRITSNALKECCEGTMSRGI
uniref:Uncharacterized protein n=1 Tax=Ignisphaera aggregans TaxID=334771 RepID=A0A7J2U2V7_9CREN